MIITDGRFLVSVLLLTMFYLMKEYTDWKIKRKTKIMTSKEDKEIEEIKRTLKARIIPNLPLEPEYLRKNIQDIIDKFEFKWYFDQERQKTIGMIDKFFVDLENMKLYTQSGCMYVTFFEDYNKIKKILLQDLKKGVEK